MSSVETPKKSKKCKEEESKSNNGLIDSYNIVGLLHENKQEYTKAIEFYEKAAALNDKKSLRNLAQIYRFGRKGIQKDIKKAISFYEKASDLRCVHSNYELGKMYYSGSEVPRDLNMAMKYFKYTCKSTIEEDGDTSIVAWANSCLGKIHDKERTFKDEKKTIEYYERAYKLGDICALRILYSIYYGQKNFVEASKIAYAAFYKDKDFLHNYQNYEEMLCLYKHVLQLETFKRSITPLISSEKYDKETMDAISTIVNSL
jgi:TPR repeat protein